MSVTRSPSVTDWHEFRTLLWQQWDGVGKHWWKRMNHHGKARQMGFEEFNQIALGALWEAAVEFQLERHVLFCSFAFRWVWGRLMTALDRQTLVKFPSTPNGYAAAARQHQQSLDTWYRTEDGWESEELADMPREECRVDREYLAARMGKLYPRLQEVVQLRYGQGMTLREVGAVMGISKERARQLCVEARWHLELLIDPRKAYA
jgi:RNA polymerase sigma factor (sigma-70 family)